MNERQDCLNEEIVDYIEKTIIPVYNGFDPAHGVSHAKTVIAESLKLSKFYDVDVNMVYCIAAYHDTGQVNGRQNHNIDSGKIIVADRVLRKWFTEEQITIMKEAAEDHRASIKHEPRSIYGKIVAEADRIISPMTTIQRAVQFGLVQNKDFDKEQHLQRASNHIIEKYGDEGYLRLWIPESDNAAKLEELRGIIRDKSRLMQIIEDIYNSEITKR